MVEPNVTLGVLEPLAFSIGWVMDALKLLLGGMFGLYLILIVLKWKETRDLKVIMQEMGKEIKEMHQTMKEMMELSKNNKKKG